MRSLSLVAMIGLALAVAGCSSVPTDAAAPSSPAFAISDGAHDGNPHVFFLPPMLPDPSARFSAAFDGSLNVEIMICVWNVSDNACGPALEIYSGNTGPGSETVRVPTAAEYYLVNWHTDAILVQSPLGPNEVYRIRVLVGSRVVAYADVQVVGAANELRNVNTGELIPLLDGRTLPIKVRIEQGWEAYSAVQTVEAGSYHTCALTGAGAAYCWGMGYYGQLGDRTFHTSGPYGSATPVAVAGGHAFVALSAGEQHSCGLTTAGAAYCWGYNGWGQLGNSNTSDQAAPVAVSGGLTFKALSAGGNHTCGLTPAGAAYCWGYNIKGQLGMGGFPSVSQTSPVPVSGGLTFVALSAGGDHTCGVAAGGAAYCWGFNGWGQLGNNSNANTTAPVLVSGGLSFIVVGAAGDGYFEQTCGLTTTGEAYCWGDVFHLFNGNPVKGPLWTPTAVGGDQAFATLRTGTDQSCGLTTAGAAYCWGWNYNGQLGTGSVTPPYSITPVAVAGGHALVSLGVGSSHSCGVTAAGEAFCWGYGEDGELGDGTFYASAPLGSPTPVAVLAPPGGW